MTGSLGRVATPPADVRSIVVLRASGLGDFVLALPALAALRAAFPRARVVYLGLPWHPELLAGRPGPWDDVEVVPDWPGVTTAPDGEAGRPAAAARRAFVARHRAAHYDLAVQLHGGGAYSTPLVRGLGARFAIGGCDVGAPPLERVVPFRHLQHEVLRALEIVGLVGAPPVSLLPTLAVTGADRREAAAALPDDPGRRPLVAVHPGAGDPRRRWPADRFARVVDALAGDGARVVLVGGAADRGLADTIRSLTRSRPRDLTGRLRLPALVGLLAGAAVMIGNDSGPRHLAAAVGAPTVGVFWCGNVINAAPLDRSRHRVATSFQTACPDCGVGQVGGRCPHDPSFVADVPVAEVLGEARNLLARDWETGRE